ncbi:hypothetical protein V1477_009069 [Vespula maculifrons]|uniref:Uncharacterized protein n=1 Tax=Vespula maculifrons TaxID=7453 RepID=A0ABD2CET9_VESMC
MKTRIARNVREDGTTANVDDDAASVDRSTEISRGISSDRFSLSSLRLARRGQVFRPSRGRIKETADGSTTGRRRRDDDDDDEEEEEEEENENDENDEDDEDDEDEDEDGAEAVLGISGERP